VARFIRGILVIAVVFACSFSAALGLTVTQSSSARTAANTARSTAAGRALARSMLLHVADFGSGWSSTAPPRKVPPLTCPGASSARRRERRIGAAVSPIFGASSTGPFVAQVVYAYASRSARAASWRADVSPQLAHCAATSVNAGGGSGVSLAITGSRRLRFPKLGTELAAYRDRGTASAGGQSLKVFVDVIVIGSRRVITALSLSSLGAPVSAKLERQLVQITATRILKRWDYASRHVKQ
jgi:hypothetical protein